jgi:hypothetical protein
MDTYILHIDAYCGEDSEFKVFEAKSDDEAILIVFKNEVEEYREESMADADIIDNLSDANGDGQPYVEILSLKTKEVIFGG